MSLKSRLRPIHVRLRNNSLYEGFYLLFRPAARKGKIVGASSARVSAKKKAVVSAKVSVAQKATWTSQVKAEIIREMIGDGDYISAQKILKSLLEDAAKSPSAVLWNLQAELLLSQAKHVELLEVTTTMTDELSLPQGYYFAAQSYFARGMYDLAMQTLQAGEFIRPNHADSAYLLCDLALRTNRPEMAREVLERLVIVSARPKSWLVMANLVETDEHYQRMQAEWHRWTKGLTKSAYNKDTREYLALGAMRVGNYDLARRIWRDSLLKAGKRAGGFQALSIRKPSYSSNRAEKTLSDLNTTLRAAEIEMFLVSGTLLGCIRENQLLGHDKDIDVGIWSDVTAEQFFDVIHKSGQFLILSSRSEHIIRLKHLNGIAVDIFFHYRDPDDYWHAGVKMKWSNTPFMLEEREFLGRTHLIPTDYDTYLTENYGDWRTPKVAFDSAFDTPNGAILHEEEMIIHAFKGLQNACISGVPGTPSIYLDDLTRRGEDAFVERFRAHVATFDPATAAILNAETLDD